MNKHAVADWARTTRAALRGQGDIVDADTFTRLSEARAYFAPLFAPLSISCAALSQEVVAEVLRANLFLVTDAGAANVPLTVIGKGPVGHHSEVEWPMVRIAHPSSALSGKLMADVASPNREAKNRQLVLLRDFDAKWLFRALPHYAGAVVLPPSKSGLDGYLQEWANLHTFPLEGLRGFRPEGRAFVIHRWLGYLLHLGLVIRQSDFRLHGKRLNWPRLVQVLAANQDLREALHTAVMFEADKRASGARTREFTTASAAVSEWAPSQALATKVARLLVGWVGGDHGPQSPLTHYWQARQ